MLVDRFNRIVRAPAGEGGGGSDPADIAAMIQAEVAKAVTGLTAKNQELLDEAKKAKTEKRALEDKLKSLGNEGDIEKARALMEQMQADADLRMIVEGGKPAYEEVINRRTKGVVSRVEDEKKVLENLAKDAAARAEAAQAKWRRERLTTAVQGAVSKAKALPEAAEYIQMKAAAYFDVDDDTGAARLRDDLKDKPIDRQGNPHSLESYVDSLRDSNPFFFGVPSGGGANGGGSGSGGRGSGEPVRLDARDKRMVNSRLEDIANGKAVIAD